MIGKHTPQRSKRRGAQLLEFAITLPLFLVMLLFALDLGRIVFMSGVLHDATFTAARAGAQVGGANFDLNGAPERTSQVAYEEAMRLMPGVDAAAIQDLDIISGARCSTAGGSANTFVKVSAEHEMRFITPGLNSILGLFEGKPTWTLNAVGVAKCEVLR